MRHEVRGVALSTDKTNLANPRVAYGWRSGRDWLALSVECVGNPLPLEEGSHEQFIAEHYWGYCRQRNGGTVEYQVKHPSWNHWPQAKATLEGNVAGFYGSRFVETLSHPPTSAFLADGSAVQVQRPVRIC